ncbi:unnamed protein product [Discosporangium mesarthrocarpum]
MAVHSSKLPNCVSLVFALLVLNGCVNGDSMSSIFGSSPDLEKDAPFGAIAFSDATQKWQVVSDLPSRSVARTQALSGCQENDCKVLLLFSRGECASLSLDASNVTKAPYVSVSMDANSAINSARQACSADGGKECKATPPICN